MGISNNTLANNLYAAGLDSPYKDEVVYEGTNGYNPLTYIIGKLQTAAGGSEQIKAFKWTNYTMGTIQVTSACTAASTTSGNNLIVNVADASNFRVNDVVADNNMALGIVVSTTPTTITLAPTSVTWVAATHFTSTMTAKVMGDASQKTASAGKSGLVYTPDQSDALITVIRAGNTQNGDDRIRTYPGGVWAHEQDKLTLMDFGRTKEKLAAFSVQVENVNGGNTNMTAGLRWSIYNKGGTATTTSGQWTEAQLQRHISMMVAKKAGGRGRRYLVPAGQDFIANFQANIAKPYMTTAGKNSIFADLKATDSVLQGLNVYRYAFGGAEVEFINWDLLDDPYLWAGMPAPAGMNGTKWSNSAWWLDMSNLPTVTGGTKPMIQQRHYGEKEIYTSYLPGIGTDITDMQIMEASGRNIVVSDVDSRSLQILSRVGWNMEAAGLGIMEPA